jgi:CheY-like chemotaxis protein
MGLRVTIVDDGRAAVEAWKSQRFDLILMDCQMPADYERTPCAGS